MFRINCFSAVASIIFLTFICPYELVHITLTHEANLLDLRHDLLPLQLSFDNSFTVGSGFLTLTFQNKFFKTDAVSDYCNDGREKPLSDSMF